MQKDTLFDKQAKVFEDEAADNDLDLLFHDEEDIDLPLLPVTSDIRLLFFLPQTR